MKPRLLLLPAGLVAAGLVGWFAAGRQAVRPEPVGAAAAVQATPAAGKPAASAGNVLKVEREAAAVFQRAFWRRPGPGDRILHGERREWVDAGAAVQKWQWFVAVAPSPEFRRWLLEDNPFELAPAGADAPVAAGENPPAWFPTREALAGLAQFRNRGGHFVVFHDSKSGRIFAADAGSGFAAAKR